VCNNVCVCVCVCVCVLAPPAECSPGFSLFLQGCVKLCPPGFVSAPQLLNLSLETWVDLSSVEACLPCHPACLTCSGPGAAACLSCPPRSRLELTACLHQSLVVQRKSPPPPPPLDHAPAAGLRRDEGTWQEVESSAGREEDASGGEGVPRTANTIAAASTMTMVFSSRPLVLSAVLAAALLLGGCLGLALLLLLQTRAGAGGGRLDTWSGVWARLGLRPDRSREGKTRICYRGIPTVWGDKDGGGGVPGESESDGEEAHGERTAFIRTQSSV